MNSKIAKTAAVGMALMMGLVTMAPAQPYRGGDRDNHGNMRPAPMQPGPGRHGPPAHRPMDRGPGAGPDHRFHRGDRLPAEYRNRQYVVNNWRSHRLHAPPRGYQWVQVGADFALVAIATGLITQLILNQ